MHHGLIHAVLARISKCRQIHIFVLIWAEIFLRATFTLLHLWLPPWVIALSTLVGFGLESSSAKVTAVKTHEHLPLTWSEITWQVDRTRDTWFRQKKREILKIFQNTDNLPKSEHLLKIFQESENLPQVWKSSKNSKIFQKSKNFQESENYPQI